MQTSSASDASRVELIVTILPSMNKNLIISLGLLPIFLASSLRLISPHMVITLSWLLSFLLFPVTKFDVLLVKPVSFLLFFNKTTLFHIHLKFNR